MLRAYSNGEIVVVLEECLVVWVRFWGMPRGRRERLDLFFVRPDLPILCGDCWCFVME